MLKKRLKCKIIKLIKDSFSKAQTYNHIWKVQKVCIIYALHVTVCENTPKLV